MHYFWKSSRTKFPLAPTQIHPYMRVGFDYWLNNVNFLLENDLRVQIQIDLIRIGRRTQENILHTSAPI